MENEARFEINEDPVWPELVRMLSGPGPDNRTAEVVVDRRFAIGAGFYKDVASSVLTASEAVTELVCSADPPQKVVLVG